MRIVIVGTGTDVGKTHVACALVRAMRDAGTRVVGWKPIASGVSAEPGDAEMLAEASGGEVVAPLYSFAEPISPHLAARRAGVVIDVEAIARRAAEIEAGAEAIVVETAGGLFSPLAPGVFNIDLVKRLGAERLVLVAPDRIGVLHDVRATVVAARAEGVVLEAIILSAIEATDASSGTNAHEITTMLGLPVIAVFPRASLTEASTRDAASRLRGARA